ncbi:hypothetical protein EPN54_04500 [bacterium]|nr:MAG: hypothetical protein EPN54_04500 [bacterium]
MPSYARRHQLTGSLAYHAFNRSNARIPIFRTQNDYGHFIRLLKDYRNQFAIKLYHWVIMNNHYHILFEIETPENTSKFMAGLARAYTHYHHKTYHGSGFLWQGRFKLQPVQKEKYLIICGRYIERNPVQANVVLEAQNYPYSSSRFYCSGFHDGITFEDPLYKDFGNESNTRQEKYKEFLRNFDSEEEKAFQELESPQGDKEFIKKLIKEGGRYMPRRKGQPR